MVKIRSIKKEQYKGYVYDLSIKNSSSPYFFANRILTHNSLYPHIMIQANLYGRQKVIDNRPTHKNNKWSTEGKYYSDKLSGVGQLLHKWYQDRLVLKKEKDRREYTIKIIINAIYGILNNAHYERVYDKVAGGDCTRLGRQWTRYARKVYKEAGYKVVYTDTDSVYVIDTFDDKVKLLEIRDKIVNDIKSDVPFPKDTFDMGIDDEIKYMFFFKGKHIDDKESDKEMDEDDFINKPLGYMKKNYIYVTKDSRVVIKNLGIKKKSNSQLSRKIFWEHLVPEIKTGKIKFSRTMIKNLIQQLLEKDLSLAAMRKSVGEFSDYEHTSPNSMPAQISKRYGAGIHFLIPNNRGIGAGKGKKLCTMEEFKEHNMRLDNIDLDNVWRELNYFIRQSVTKNIFDF